MSNPTIISNLLQQTLVSKTESIKKAQQTLQQLQDDPNFLPHLLMIPKQASVPRDIRKAACLYTKKFAKNKLIEKDHQKILGITQLLMAALAQSSIELPLRKYIGRTIQFMLVNDVEHKVRNLLNPYCVNLLESAKTQTNSITNFEYVGFFVQTLMSSFLHLTQQINIFIQQSFVSFCQLNIQLFAIVDEAMKYPDKQKILYIFRLLRLYSHTVRSYMKRMLLAKLRTVQVLYHAPVAQLLKIGLKFTLQNNQIKTNFIYYNPQADAQIIELYHFIKADYVQSACFLLRTVHTQFKDAKMIANHEILSSKQFVPDIIEGLNQFLSVMPYYKIKSPSLVNLIQQILVSLTFASRNSFYYQICHKYKKQIFDGCILKILSFSPVDCDTFSNDPDEFINQILQIIEMDSYSYIQNKDKASIFSENNDDVQEYSNLRTIAASLLFSYAKYIDGTLSQIVNASFPVLKNQVNSDIPKSTLLMILCILREQIVEKEQRGQQIMGIICTLLTNRNIPPQIKDPQATPMTVYGQNIEYLVILQTVFKFLTKVPIINDDEISVINHCVYNILSKTDVSQALKIAALDLVVSVCERQPKFQCKYIQVLNELCYKRAQDREKCLQTLANLFSYSTSGIDEMAEYVIITIKNLVAIVHSQASKTSPIQLVINKCWNIISDICQNQVYIPKLIPQIQQNIMPLLPFIDGKRNLDYEEDIFMMMSSFISKSKSVTHNQLIMFEIIPKLFYTQYQYRFGHAFQTLNTFIMYGSSILSVAPQAIQAIIDMTISSMNTIKVKDNLRTQAQNCEGLLILHSLMMSCGNAFSNQNWITVAKALTLRLQNPPVKGHILNSNIFAGLTFVLMLGHKSFSYEDCDIILNKILQNSFCFVVQYSIKVAIVALSQILCLYNLPFVANKFVFLFDTIITLLEAFQNKQLFRKRVDKREQHQQYDLYLSTMTNKVTLLDEIQFVQSKINSIKQSNSVLLQAAMAQLPQNKTKFINNLMATKKVLDENRTIFKIKR